MEDVSLREDYPNRKTPSVQAPLGPVLDVLPPEEASSLRAFLLDSQRMGEAALRILHRDQLGVLACE